MKPKTERQSDTHPRTPKPTEDCLTSISATESKLYPVPTDEEKVKEFMATICGPEPMLYNGKKVEGDCTITGFVVD
ncbi:MAG: hypothetical protein ACI305_00460 [Lepagella sp.]